VFSLLRDLKKSRGLGRSKSFGWAEAFCRKEGEAEDAEAALNALLQQTGCGQALGYLVTVLALKKHLKPP
jgi:hypothetical protein